MKTTLLLLLLDCLRDIRAACWNSFAIGEDRINLV